MSPQSICIAQLYEVLARVGVLDARIGKVLHTQGQLVLAAFTKLTPDREMISKIELSAAALVLKQRNDVVGADAEFCEPIVLAPRGLQPNHRCQTDLRGPC